MVIVSGFMIGLDRIFCVILVFGIRPDRANFFIVVFMWIAKGELLIVLEGLFEMMVSFGRLRVRGNLGMWLIERDLSLDKNYVIEVH
jgi:hypothetical protein